MMKPETLSFVEEVARRTWSDVKRRTTGNFQRRARCCSIRNLIRLVLSDSGDARSNQQSQKNLRSLSPAHAAAEIRRQHQDRKMETDTRCVYLYAGSTIHRINVCFVFSDNMSIKKCQTDHCILAGHKYFHKNHCHMLILRKTCSLNFSRTRSDEEKVPLSLSHSYFRILRSLTTMSTERNPGCSRTQMGRNQWSWQERGILCSSTQQHQHTVRFQLTTFCTWLSLAQ